MLTLSDRDSTAIHAQDLMFDKLKQQIRCAVPGIIQSFDNIKCTAEVQPAITEIFYNYNGEKKNIKLPLLQDVPVIFPASGSAMLSFPVNKGDECLLIFADMCIDGWWQNGDIQNQAEQRRHDLSDAFAILSPFSQPKAGKITNGINKTQTELRNMSDTQKVVVTDKKVDLIGNVLVNGEPIGSGGATTVTVEVGKTTTGEPGTNAQVTNSGTDVNAVFNFTIPRGDTGEKGETGSPGKQGEPGTPGTDGKAATIQAGTVTTLDPGESATVTNAGTENAAIFNFGIPKGEQGLKGNAGDAATVTVGTVTTLPAGTDATVENAGTSSAAVFNFGIPQGDKGEQGEKGDTGNPGEAGKAATIEVGTTTNLVPGSRATVTNSGTDSAAVFNFGIPRGEDGEAATVDVGSVTTLPAGSDATVTNTGTAKDAIFNFGIPQGTKGETGDKGDTGAAATISVGNTTTLPAGSSATVTNAGTSSAAVFNFGIPKGDKGENGDAATIAVGTTTTLTPGTSATVTNAGTSSAAVFNFGIPKGSQGDAATIQVGTVTTLPAGSNATVTNSGTSSAAVFDFGIPKGDTGAVSNVSYNDLLNKPSINGHTITGAMTDANLEIYGKNNVPPYPVTSVNGQTGDVSLNIPNILTLTNVSAANWVSSQTYTDYPYQCSIANSAISALSFVDIVFDAASATSGDYAPICSTESGKVVIFSKTNTAIIIPTILVVNP